MPPALVAQALRTASPRAEDEGGSSPGRDRDGIDPTRFLETAKSAVASYMETRSAATRPPDGLADSLETIKRHLSGPGGKAVVLAGISAFPPTELKTFFADSPLRRTFDHVYTLGKGGDGDRSPGDDWIRTMPGRIEWPSATAMKAVCAAHRVPPSDAVLIGGDLAGEIGPALDLGMRAVHVRQVPPGEAAIGRESLTPATSRRPDGVVTRLDDLPKLSLFQAGQGPRSVPNLVRPDDRSR